MRKVLAAGFGIQGLLISVGAAMAAPPPFTLTSVARSGQFVNGTDQISSAVAFGLGQGPGVVKVAVNNSGDWLTVVHMVNTDVNADEAVLRSGLGLASYVQESEGSIEPTAIHSLSLSSTGHTALALTAPSPSGVYYDLGTVPIQVGAAANATGLAAGTTWAALDAESVVRLTDTGRLLVVSKVNELSILRRVVMVAQLDVGGSVTSLTLVAKEGGPVGAGPDTWMSIAGGGHAAAINSSGAVVFSGTTSGGTRGVYSTAGAGGFVATQGGPTPVPGQSWGDLFSAPVDINSAGTVALRGRLADGNGQYTENAPDAGDTADTSDRSFGNGALTRLNGSLSNDHDVDMYRIVITDPATFSATTVPDLGNGFAGASWDTALSLIASPENGTAARVFCDNVSPTVLQSTLTDPLAIAGREFYICISTPKSRPVARVQYFSTNSFPLLDLWSADPAGLAIGGGLAYWPDPSEGTIRRATTGGGLQSDLPGAAISAHIALDAAGGKIYWIDRGAGTNPRIRRSNLDGSSPEEIVTASGFGTVNASDATGLALDLTNGKVYWSRAGFGEVNRCNLNGTSPERVIQDYPPTDAIFPPGPGLPVGNLSPASLAVDPVGGKIYWYNTFLDRIERLNLNSTGRTNLNVGAGARGIALDVANGRIYWTNTAGNKIQRSNLDGSGVADVLSTQSPVAIALDVPGGLVYWTSTVDRVVRRATLSGTGIADVVSAGPDIGERRADGPGAGSTFSQWSRIGTVGGGSLPYQIKLTGATFRHDFTMIAKGTQKVVGSGDVIAGTAPNRVISVGDADAVIRLSDRGDVLWTGLFDQPTSFNNYLFDGLFWNGERLMASMDVLSPINVGPQKMINFYKHGYSIDMSDNGEWAMIAANMQIPPYTFTAQPDHALLLNFTLPSSCIADFNNSGAATVQDIFDFLAAYFSNAPAADVNNSGSVTVQDIFDFLAVYFAGCP